MNQRIVIASNEKIRSIVKILKLIEDCHNKYKEVFKDWFIFQSVADLVKHLQVESKCKNIEEKINRPETKVFFVGKASVGKSKIINAILGTDLLVSVSSDSTCCFVHLKKSSNSDWLIKYRGHEQKCNDIDDLKSKLKNLTSSHDLNNKNKLNFDESVECFVVCNNENKIFKNNTEIVDCPGSSNKQEITECIKQHSLNADIFVFVVKDNITDDDEIFFEYQSDQSTKPDIFILVNACDSGDDDDQEWNNKSMAKIKEKCRRFLQKHYDEDEDIDKRIFMISAKEMLNIRMKKKKENTVKQNKRCKEFENFENYLANYIADPIKNKMRRYEKDISAISDEVENAIEIFSENINNQGNDFIFRNFQRKIDALELLIQKISKNCEDFKLNMQENLRNMIDVVDLFNLDVVNNEIKHRYKTFDEQILRFAANQEIETTVFLKAEDLDKSFKYNWENKMKSLLNAFSEVKSILKKDDNFTSKAVSRLLPFIPIVGIIGTNIVLSRLDEVHINNEIFRKKYIEELKGEIYLMNEKADQIIVKNADIIEKEIHSNIDNIRRIFADKMKSFNNYWKEINDCMIRCKSILANAG